MSSIEYRSLLLVVAVAAVGCATTGANRNRSDTPEGAYAGAMEHLTDGDYTEAQSAFAAVRTRFPYSKYAALADLRGGDTLYEQGRFIEAIDAYRQFEKMHPQHEEVPYALWRIGEASYEQAPEEWWFTPPTAEKDQASILQALVAYRDVVDRYGTSDYAAKARAKTLTCRRRLADHELYVARFYWRRDHWQAAAVRAEGLARDYPDVGLESTALLLAARARAKAGEPLLARAAAQQLVDKYPKSEEVAAAQSLLHELKAVSSTSSPQGG